MKSTRILALRLLAVLLLIFIAARALYGNTFTWTGAVSSDWANAANWNPTGLPGMNDGAVVTNGAVNIAGTVAVSSISLGGNGSLTLAGGAILNAVVSTANGESLVVSGGTLDGVTVNGVLDVGNSVSGARLTVINGLTLNGTMLVGNPTNGGYGVVDFAGSQGLGGNGTVVFGFNSYNSMVLANAGTTLVLGPGIRVHGQNGAVGSSPYVGGARDASVANQGTISADVSGGTIAIAGGSFNNAGILEASNGGLLAVQDMTGNVGQVSLGAGTTLSLDGSYTNNLTLNVPANAVLNLAGNWSNPGSISGSLGTLNLSGSLDNTALTGNWSNNGQIQATGGVLVLGPSWTTNVNNGVVQASGGTLNLEGVFTLAMVQSLQLGVGETVNITGTLDNTNTTLVVDGGEAAWSLNGTIAGGTVATTNGGSLVVGSGTLNGATVNGVLDVGNSVSGARLTVTNGLTLNGTMLVGNPTTGGYGVVGFAGSQELGGNGAVVFGFHPYNSMVLATAGTTLAIGPGVRVHGQNGWIGYNPYGFGSNGGSVANQGTISADVSGGSISIAGGSFNNAGTLETSSGGLLTVQDMTGNVGQVSVGAGTTLSLDGSYTNNLTLNVPANATLNLAGNWSNPGRIIGSQGTLNLSGSFGNTALTGNWSNSGQIQATGGVLVLGPSWATNANQGVLQAGGGTLSLEGAFTLAMVQSLQLGVGENVNITGTLDNTNTTLVVDGGEAAWSLNGTIAGGTVATTNGGSLVVGSGTLNGATVNGVLDVGNSISGARLTVTNGLALNGTMLVGNPTNGGYGTVGFAGSQVLGGNGAVVFGFHPYNSVVPANAGTTLVVGPGIRVHGRNGGIGYNPYTGAGSTGGSVANQGTISADVSGGTISIAGASFNNAGTLEAQNGGVIQPTSTTTVNTGIITVQTGTMTFANGFTQSEGILDIGLNSSTDFGQIKFSGAATLGGTLAAHLNSGYLPNIGVAFAVLNYANNNLSFTNLSFPPGYSWQSNSTNGVLTLVMQGILPTSVTVTPTNSIVAVGSTVTLAAGATGPGSLRFQWLQNGTNIIGATNATLVLTNVPKSATGAYTVSVSNSGANLVSAPVQVLVLALPAFVSLPQSQTASLGAAVALTATVSGDPPLTYQWVFNGANLAGATNATLSFSDVSRAQGGSYVLLVSNLVGSATSAPPAVLTITNNLLCPGAPSGMVAWWRGDDDSSDFAGTNDAVFEGAVAYAPGEVGQAFSFDGTTSFLQVSNSPLWNFGTNDFSFEFWANFGRTNASLPAGDGSMALLAHDEQSGARDKWIFGFGGGESYLYINGSGVGPHFLVQAPFNPNTNQWYHLGLTKGGGVLRVYVNGSEASSQTNTLSIPAAAAPLTIGQAENAYFMQGLMDEISIYNRALQPGEVQAIYQAGSKGKCSTSQLITIEQAGFNSSGKFQFQILGGQVGAGIEVQSSPDLKNWANVWQAVLGNTPLLFTDPAATPKQQLYYRILANP